MYPFRLSVFLSLLALACGGGSTSTPPKGPVANAGLDQAVASGAVVTLDGSASSDPAGLALTYQWTQSSGATVTLSSASAAKPTFTAPVMLAGQPPAALVFSLQVSTADGTSTATVTVTVNAALGHLPPVANAGPNQAVPSGAAVTLDGSGSGDPGGQTITYLWTQTSGQPAVTLSAAGTAHPTFAAPTVSSVVALGFSLVVNDANGSSSPSTVTIFVNPAGSSNLPPPGTPPPAPPDPNPPPAGGGGSHRFEMGTYLQTGLYLVDPVPGEASVVGLVVVSFGTSIEPAPADAEVTMNGVKLRRLPSPPSTGLFWELDPAGPQPIVGSGGQLVLVAKATDPTSLKQVQRTLVLPCPSDIQVTTTPPIGGPLALSPTGGLHLTWTSSISLNPGVQIMEPYQPKAMLFGYEPANRTLVGYGSPQTIQPGSLSLDLPVCNGNNTGTCVPTTGSAYLLDLRWPGVFIIDGQSGGFCGLAKRLFFTK